MAESRWKKVVRIYCERSTIHGFIELYYARSWFWMLFWTFIVGGGIGITTYQVKQEITQFAADRNLALISPIDTGEGIYPEVSICYMHWVYWLDWKKVKKLGFTKRSILVALSLFGNVISSQRFDVDAARQEFADLMSKNNFTFVSQLFYNVSIDLPLSNLSTGYLLDSATFFREKRIDFKESVNLLCFVTPSEFVKAYLQNTSFSGSSRESISNSLFSFAMQDPTYENSPCKDMIDEHEYNYFLYAWLINDPNFYLDEVQALSTNFTPFAMPMLLYPDGQADDEVQIVSEREAYRIQFDPSVHQRRSTPKYRCATGQKSVTSNFTCTKKCWYKYPDDVSVCAPLGYLAYVNEDTIRNLCFGVVQFLDDLKPDGKRALRPDGRPPRQKFYKNEPFERESLYKNQSVVKNLLQRCNFRCPAECEQWMYTFSYSKLTVYRIPSQLLFKNTTNIDIEYPLEEDILMLIDAEGQTWYDFIGNVGGILGIWIGASIISFLQLIYVFCCVETKCCSKKKPSRGNGSTSSKIKITVNKHVTVSPAGS